MTKQLKTIFYGQIDRLLGFLIGKPVEKMETDNKTIRTYIDYLFNFFKIFIENYPQSAFQDSIVEGGFLDDYAGEIQTLILDVSLALANDLVARNGSKNVWFILYEPKSNKLSKEEKDSLIKECRANGQTVTI